MSRNRRQDHNAPNHCEQRRNHRGRHRNRQRCHRSQQIYRRPYKAQALAAAKRDLAVGIAQVLGSGHNLGMRLTSLPRLAAARPLRVDFLAVGQGDAALITSPAGKTELIDGGPREARDTVLTRLFNVGWDAPHRVLRNSTYERWEAAGRPEAGQRPSEDEEVVPGIVRYAINSPLSASKGDVEAMAMYAGQGVGAIDTVESAAAIIERFAATLRPS